MKEGRARELFLGRVAPLDPGDKKAAQLFFGADLAPRALFGLPMTPWVDFGNRSPGALQPPIWGPKLRDLAPYQDESNPS